MKRMSLFALGLSASVLLIAGRATANGDKILQYKATIDGAQEVPPNGSPGTGSATILINTTTNELTFDISFSGLTSAELAAHFHGPAPVGMNAGVLFGLPLGSPKVGVWNYLEAQEADILAGLIYINIHSDLAPGGEIRGQVVEDCGAGNVYACVFNQEVLKINGSAGLPGCREVVVPTGMDITISLDTSLGGPLADARYVVYAWRCDPRAPTLLRGAGSTLGCTVNPTPLQGGGPQPFRCVRGTGLPGLVCGAVPVVAGSPARAPWMLTKPGGFNSPIRLTLQGLLEDNCPDPSLGNTSGFSVTNMVVLVVQ